MNLKLFTRNGSKTVNPYLEASVSQIVFDIMKTFIGIQIKGSVLQLQKTSLRQPPFFFMSTLRSSIQGWDYAFL